MARKKIKRAFGFDPGINESAWAVVDEYGHVRCGLIRNTYQGSADPWSKLATMMHLVEDELPKIRNVSVVVCEGQYTARRGDPAHMVRLGWISALVYGMMRKAAPRMIAIPATWTRNKPKEMRHSELKKKVKPEDQWEWTGPVAPASLLHNVRDAVGLAVWGMEQI